MMKFCLTNIIDKRTSVRMAAMEIEIIHHRRRLLHCCWHFKSSMSSFKNLVAFSLMNYDCRINHLWKWMKILHDLKIIILSRWNKFSHFLWDFEDEISTFPCFIWVSWTRECLVSFQMKWQTVKRRWTTTIYRLYCVKKITKTCLETPREWKNGKIAWTRFSNNSCSFTQFIHFTYKWNFQFFFFYLREMLEWRKNSAIHSSLNANLNEKKKVSETFSHLMDKFLNFSYFCRISLLSSIWNEL